MVTPNSEHQIYTESLIAEFHFVPIHFDFVPDNHQNAGINFPEVLSVRWE
jgi:hypothetical protein